MNPAYFYAIFASTIVALASGGQALAAQTKKTDLVSAGYKCERAGVNFTECTKDGAPTYWCGDDGKCEKASAGGKGAGSVRPGKGNLVGVDRN